MTVYGKVLYVVTVILIVMLTSVQSRLNSAREQLEAITSKQIQCRIIFNKSVAHMPCTIVSNTDEVVAELRL